MNTIQTHYSPCPETLDVPDTYHDFVVGNFQALLDQCPADPDKRHGWMKACFVMLDEVELYGKRPHDQVRAWQLLMAEKMVGRDWDALRRAVQQIEERRAA